jgi:hypothetical protein
MTRCCRLTTSVVFACALACSPSSQTEAEHLAPSPQTLADALTFHAAFDDSMDASYALGDNRIFSAPSFDELDQRTPGVIEGDIVIEPGAGRYGHALNFRTQNTKAVFYAAQGNVSFSPESWSGTISFWLNLDPASDLEPGYSDPIQVTDTAYNDNAIWVDFTDKNPRRFRLGVFGELDVWNQGQPNPSSNPAFNSRLVRVRELPFARGRWTHIAIVHEGLGGGAGSAALYLDGVEQGRSTDIAEPFGWDPSTAAVRIGVNYVGLFDELALFNRALTAQEIETLRTLEGGVSALHD